jgi:hypothetical protein
MIDSPPPPFHTEEEEEEEEEKTAKERGPVCVLNYRLSLNWV